MNLILNLAFSCSPMDLLKRSMRSSYQMDFINFLSKSNGVHRGAFWQFPFRWIYYCHSTNSTGKETGKMHLCGALENTFKRWQSRPLYFETKFECCWIILNTETVFLWSVGQNICNSTISNTPSFVPSSFSSSRHHFDSWQRQMHTESFDEFILWFHNIDFKRRKFLEIGVPNYLCFKE